MSTENMENNLAANGEPVTPATPIIPAVQPVETPSLHQQVDAAAAAPPASPTSEPTPVERMASDAYAHTSEAADAFRRAKCCRTAR